MPKGVPDLMSARHMISNCIILEHPKKKVYRPYMTSTFLMRSALHSVDHWGLWESCQTHPHAKIWPRNHHPVSPRYGTSTTRLHDSRARYRPGGTSVSAGRRESAVGVSFEHILNGSGALNLAKDRSLPQNSTTPNSRHGPVALFQSVDKVDHLIGGGVMPLNRVRLPPPPYYGVTSKVQTSGHQPSRCSLPKHLNQRRRRGVVQRQPTTTMGRRAIQLSVHCTDDQRGRRSTLPNDDSGVGRGQDRHGDVVGNTESMATASMRKTLGDGEGLRERVGLLIERVGEAFVLHLYRRPFVSGNWIAKSQSCTGTKKVLLRTQNTSPSVTHSPYGLNTIPQRQRGAFEAVLGWMQPRMSFGEAGVHMAIRRYFGRQMCFERVAVGDSSDSVGGRAVLWTVGGEGGGYAS
ncbi:hypothetical protein FB45DRAFT_1011388 [Roridomyces roridus]|uniref:Uncharacterized protein n=1 Tax=Roridomyces roridus TaxID=1738132 RepID=A0AAD7B1G0_9AGAR|nr:hypothetical protein FB45DRAFT_1011388 [Roridomyces roridus]